MSSTAQAAPNGGIVLVGHPNVGKSVLFQHLTGRYTNVSNYPGTTVAISRGTARFAPEKAVFDTPGIVTLPARGEDERVAFRLLLQHPVEAVVQVGDAKSLRRTLLMTLQLVELGLPLVLVLNMMDEAAARGLELDAEKLSGLLGVTVVCAVATERSGVDDLVAAVGRPEPASSSLRYPEPVERFLDQIEPFFEGAIVSPRGLALLWLTGDDFAGSLLTASAPDGVEQALAERLEVLDREHREPLRAVVERVRHERADAIAAEVLRERHAGHRNIAARLAHLTTHRLWGWPILAAVLFAVYWFVGVLGAGKLVGWLEGTLFGEILNPRVTQGVESLVPWEPASSFLVGEYGLWTLGMTYAFALILPIVATFFVAFSVLEDSGYLPRLAVVSNRAFTAMGLNGKAVLPMVLGLGCVTMATLTTRTLDTRRERLLATLLLALGIPCSAQLGVVLGMLGAVSLAATLVWGVVVGAVVFAVGLIAARLLPGERTALVVELPPLRVPRAANVLTKTLARLEWYMREVVPLFLLATWALFVLDRTGALGVFVTAAEPLVTGWLGLPAAASAAFLVGFVRRDFGAAGLFAMQAAGRLTPEQTLVAMVTITLFVPCLASVLVIVRERGLRTAVGVLAVVFPLAFLVGGLLHRALLLTGWGLA